MDKKKHHYIPKAYLKAFADEDGKVHVCRKDEPTKVFRQSPGGVGFHKYYHSQPLPDGGMDHNKLEDFFSQYEGRWPGIVERIRRKENVNESIRDIFFFIGLQRFRVPAFRDSAENKLATLVKASIKHQKEATEELLQLPKGFEHGYNNFDVPIDPYQSILAMGHVLREFDKFLNEIGICVFHNTTDIPYLTSDNPVMWFDPSIPDKEMLPYNVRKGGPITFLFPIAPDLLIYGDSNIKAQFEQYGLTYSEDDEPGSIKAANSYVCQFAYEAVFGPEDGFKKLVQQHADISPVLKCQIIPAPKGQLVLSQFIWGKRTRKPKWKQSEQ